MNPIGRSSMQPNNNFDDVTVFVRREIATNTPDSIALAIAMLTKHGRQIPQKLSELDALHKNGSIGRDAEFAKQIDALKTALLNEITCS